VVLDHTATPKTAWLTVPPPAVSPISVLVQSSRKHTCDSALVQALRQAAVGEQGFPQLLLACMQLLQRAHLCMSTAVVTSRVQWHTNVPPATGPYCCMLRLREFRSQAACRTGWQ